MTRKCGGRRSFPEHSGLTSRALDFALLPTIVTIRRIKPLFSQAALRVMPMATTLLLARGVLSGKGEGRQFFACRTKGMIHYSIVNPIAIAAHHAQDYSDIVYQSRIF